MDDLVDEAFDDTFDDQTINIKQKIFENKQKQKGFVKKMKKYKGLAKSIDKKNILEFDKEKDIKNKKNKDNNNNIENDDIIKRVEDPINSKTEFERFASATTEDVNILFPKPTVNLKSTLKRLTDSFISVRMNVRKSINQPNILANKKDKYSKHINAESIIPIQIKTKKNIFNNDESFKNPLDRWKNDTTNTDYINITTNNKKTESMEDLSNREERIRACLIKIFELQHKKEEEANNTIYVKQTKGSKYLFPKRKSKTNKNKHRNKNDSIDEEDEDDIRIENLKSLNSPGIRVSNSNTSNLKFPSIKARFLGLFSSKP
jgi:hypothetical protein